MYNLYIEEKKEKEKKEKEKIKKKERMYKRKFESKIILKNDRKYSFNV